jgi:hypothetical protein
MVCKLDQVRPLVTGQFPLTVSTGAKTKRTENKKTHRFTNDNRRQNKRGKHKLNKESKKRYSLSDLVRIHLARRKA